MCKRFSAREFKSGDNFPPQELTRDDVLDARERAACEYQEPFLATDAALPSSA
jgi:hypothetical protein